jgi:biotin/methionine sulfoxide reductase
MLGLAHTLLVEGLADREFLQRYTTGAGTFEAYVLGTSDGVAKDAQWASAKCEIPADDIRQLARRMASVRTLVTVTWSLQRIPNGEQPVWAGLALAALLGQIGLPGGGFGHGYGSMGDVGSTGPAVGLPHFPKGSNPVRDFIPVARISDLLLSPGEEFTYDGGTYTYPDVRLVYWAGGNPFHHHQDLNRLRRALGRPDTVIVHEPYWTPMARHADLIFPATTTFERNDIGSGRADARIVAMHRAVEPHAEARHDHDIFTGLAERLGVARAFTDERDERAWLSSMWAKLRASFEAVGVAAPDFETFWRDGSFAVPDLESERVLFGAFRADPARNPLRTPSGRIELYSETIAGFGYDDCPGHPTWLDKSEAPGAPLARRYPLTLVANNPATRLHSQLDHGAYSQSAKVQGREPVRIHPADAAARGIASGDIVRLSNDRGSCLAGAVLTEDVRRGVVQLSTGAWFDPDDPAAEIAMCVHGNPNMLTRDTGTSRLSQGCSGQHALVEVERWNGPLPPVRAFDPPAVAERDQGTRKPM